MSRRSGGSSSRRSHQQGSTGAAGRAASPDDGPTVHGWRQRLRPALRCGLVGLAVIGAAGALSEVVRLELLTATLAPTVYHLASAPGSLPSRRRNVAAGHVGAVVLGLAAAAAFGVEGTTGPGQVLPVRAAVAATVTLAVTLFVLELADLHHPPAAATGLLVSSGLVSFGTPLLGLALGLGLAVLVAPPLTRFVQRDVVGRAPSAQAG